jgi:hypothetical protein
MADPALAGDLLQASVPSLPAATTTVIPDATTESTASFKALDNPPPKDILAMHFLPFGQFVITCSNPSITPTIVPPPLEDSTFTAQRSQLLLLV